MKVTPRARTHNDRAGDPLHRLNNGRMVLVPDRDFKPKKAD